MCFVGGYNMVGKHYIIVVVILLCLGPKTDIGTGNPRVQRGILHTSGCGIELRETRTEKKSIYIYP